MWITGCGVLHYIAQLGLACEGCDSKSAFDVRWGVISEFIRAKKKKGKKKAWVSADDY